MRARAEQIEVEQATEDALYVKEVDNKMTKRSFLPMTKTKRRDTAVALDDETGRLSFYEQEQAKTSASRGAGTPGKFPERERAGCCAVFNPYADARIAWDTVALCFVMYVMFITPYQLAFIMNEPKLSEINKVFAPENKSRMPLMVIDSVVDLFFLVDIFFQCNTAVYIELRDVWIMDRRELFMRYQASGWLYVDIASLLPYDELSGDDRLTMMRLLKLLRLFKLLKVLRAPRIIAKWNKIFSLSFKTGLILKYTIVLFTILHLSACIIRLGHDLQTNDGRKHHVETYLSTRGPTLHRGKFNKGNFNVYMDALDWGLQTLTGASLYITTVEACMCVVMNLAGLLFFSFLIADLTNILCNLDPAANEFKQTVDCLNEFMLRERFPRATRYELKEYLTHSEVLFRVKFHNELISRLSPPLQAQVCSMLLGKRIVGIPFFSYAKACELRLQCGSLIFNLDDFLEPINNNGHGAGRPASASKAALQDFFCGTNGDDQERRA